MMPKQSKPGRGRPDPVITVQRHGDRAAAGQRGMASGALAARARSQGAEMVLIKDLADNPENPRTQVDTAKDRELADDMAAQGVLQPLLVVSAEAFLRHRADVDGVAEAIGDRPWVILAGFRRRRAAQAAGLTEVPVYVRDELAGVREAARVMRAENQHRVNLTALEEARQLGDLRDRENMSQRELAHAMGMSPGQVAKRLKLLKLPADGAELLARNRIDIQAAMALADVPEAAVREAVIAEASRKSLTQPIGADGMDSMIDRIRRETAIEAAKAQLRSSGIPIEPWMPYQSEIVTGDDVEAARQDQTLRAHVNTYDGEIVYFRQENTQPQRPEDEGEDDDGYDQLLKQWETATIGRRQLIADVITRPLSREDQKVGTITALRSVLAYPRRGAVELIQSWVGDRWGTPSSSAAVLGWSLEINSEHLLPLALAYSLATAEVELHQAVTTDYYLAIAAQDQGDTVDLTPTTQLPTGHYDWLRDHGYEPTELERRLLSLAASMEAPRSTAEQDDPPQAEPADGTPDQSDADETAEGE